MKKFILLTIVAFCSLLMAHAQGEQTTLKVGDKVPTFTVKDAAGQERSLADLCKGKKYVMIDFWATWCVPCRKEMPNVKAQYEKFASKGFEIIGVSEDRSKPTMEAFVEKEGLKWPVFRDQTQIAAKYGVNVIPTTFIIDAEGTIVAKDLRGDDLGAKLAELMP
ncbi:MAG: TlpA family protein disulfide reductase [Bacteroidaceae bacterium]|nr:TlpA family protein disulfide reductase [Bacteroidaceae bacterium]MBR1541789.1 TlpA family protein disulfide reductase [Bacteroidaceae bacterium]